MKKIWWYIPGNFKQVFIIIGTCFSFHLCGQTISRNDYRDIFGEKYEEASSFFRSNPWITETIQQNRLDPCFVKAVIFPELIRYSTIRDKMEIRGLLTLYVQYGNDYADFSVGRFQIKPSFARQLEMDLRAHPEFRHEKLLGEIKTKETPQARLERVKRLDDPAWQLQYVIWFIKVAEREFSDVKWENEAKKLRFFATAYNCGYDHPSHYIEKMALKNYFHTSVFKSTSLYNYADISLHYWSGCSK